MTANRNAMLPVLCIAMLLTATGCTDDTAQSALRQTRMQIGSHTYTLEIADTDADRQRGLMYRDSMPADHGMIFVFDDEDIRSFWMKNTRIPLDILYLSDAGRIVSIGRMKPFDQSSVPSQGPARYAIELNAGQAERAGVQAGDILTLPADLHATADRRPR